MEHKDRNLIGYSDSAKYREKYDMVFGKKFKWIKAKPFRSFESDNCPIDGSRSFIGNLPDESIAIKCRDTVNGKCAYCGDVSVEEKTERKIQCFYPVIQRQGSWQPEKPK